MERHKVTLQRLTDLGYIDLDTWEKLISSLVLSGYEVHGDKEEIVFYLGWDDKVELEEKS